MLDIRCWMESRQVFKERPLGRLFDSARRFTASHITIIRRSKFAGHFACIFQRYDIISYPRVVMRASKIAITIDRVMLEALDRLVNERVFPNRSQAIQAAVAEKLQRLEGTRLARECAKLDPDTERALADEGLSDDLDAWPEY